jgi:hypothetical protein
MTYMFQNLPMRVQFIVSFSLYRIVSAMKFLPVSLANVNPRFGFLSDSLANKTKSAFPEVKISSAWAASVIKPTAAVKTPASFNSFGKGTW